MTIEVKLSEHKDNLTYSIQNIVVKSSLNTRKELDLKVLNAKLDNTQYSSSRFPGLFARFNHPRCVIIIFRNGKLILTGLKSSKYIDLTIERLILQLNKLLPEKLNRDYIISEIVNIVVTANLFKEINLDSAALKLNNAIYEPEVFPGLVYNSKNPVKSVFLIFSTGKIVLTGVKKEELIEPILINLGRLLKKKELFNSV
ncbi:MAG: TATA-box-binding protein [Candidatus Heimdallarchaeota archaeon]